MKDGKLPISVAIITRDEAHNLPGCLSSVSFADQVVVVDSGSTDNTVTIAGSFGCEIFFNPWSGFGQQKQFAIEQCRNEWILVLDADERIPEETAAVVRKILSESGPVNGYGFPRKNFFQGRWIKHAGWWPDHVTRLFRRSKGQLSARKVHESIQVEGRVEILDVPIEHYTESDLSKVLLKIDRYSTLGAAEAFAEGRRSTTWSAAARAVLTFVQDYFIRLGIMDGEQGLTLAITDAINKYFKYAKLAQLSRKENHKV